MAIQVQFNAQTYAIHDLDSFIVALGDRMKNWKDVMTTKECAAYLGISVRTLERWIEADKLRYHRVPDSDIKMFIKSEVLEDIKKY